MTIKPTQMSLPRAAAMPVSQMNGFSPTARKRLIRQGIVTALQLTEIASRSPSSLRKRTGVTPVKARRVIEAEFGPIPDFSNVSVANAPLPAAGVPDVGFKPPASGPERGWITRLERHLNNIRAGDAPTSYSLIPRMQAVRNQGPWPTCVSHAAIAMREFWLREELSPAYCHLGTKSIDGLSGGGTFLYYALQWQFQVGQLVERDLPYQNLMDDHNLTDYAAKAAQRRSQGHTMLNVAEISAGLRPLLLKEALAGRLFKNTAERPIGISLRIYESFVSTSSALSGIIPLPLSTEPKRGAHAMVMVGYLDAADPSNPYGIDFFIVRNSWGDWAVRSPIAPGHALIPTAYFATQDLMEAYVVFETEDEVQT